MRASHATQCTVGGWRRKTGPGGQVWVPCSILQPMTQLPHELYRPDQVAAMDRSAIREHGVSGLSLMDRAGAEAYRVLRGTWPHSRRLRVVCGTGNNGGDGFVVAFLALREGLDVTVHQLGDVRRIKGDAATVYRRYVDAGGRHEAFAGLPDEDDLVLVDALFGTGLDRALEGPWREAVDAINEAAAPVLAVDVPSGLHSDTGTVLGTAVRASATVTFIGLKRGLFTGSGPACTGRLHYRDLDVPEAVLREQQPAALRVDYHDLDHVLRPRSRDAHKGAYGHVLLVGGDHGMGGAALLAGRGALRAGAGLVSVATRERHVAGLLAAQPELMTHAVEGAADLEAPARRASVLLIGPGLGRGDWGRTLFADTLARDMPMVLDADALNLLAEEPGRRHDRVLTPHPGEAARLLDVTTADVQADRFAAVEALLERYGGTVVLKGAGSIVGTVGQTPRVCHGGNPGLASGGTGDVLAGVVAGFLAQGHSPFEAAVLAVCVHAGAADRLALKEGERGLLASDLPPVIRLLVNP